MDRERGRVPAKPPADHLVHGEGGCAARLDRDPRVHPEVAAPAPGAGRVHLHHRLGHRGRVGGEPDRLAARGAPLGGGPRVPGALRAEEPRERERDSVHRPPPPPRHAPHPRGAGAIGGRRGRPPRFIDLAPPPDTSPRRYHCRTGTHSPATETPSDREAKIRAHRPPQHGDDIRGGRPQERDPVGGGPRPRGPPRARGEPHRHRRPLRRRGAPHRALDARTPAGLLPRDEDRRAHLRRRPRRDPPFPRPAPGRRGRPPPAPFPRPPRRLGDRDGGGRGPRGGDRSARARPHPLHRGDRARVDHRLDAPEEPRALRLRLGAPPLELRDARERALSQGVRGGARALGEARRRGADDQVDRARPVGHDRPGPQHLVPAVRDPG